MSRVSDSRPIPTQRRRTPSAPLGARAKGSEATEPASNYAQLPFEQAAAAVLGDLQHALADLLKAAPGEIRKISDIERAFGTNHLLSWQVFRIVHAENPLAAGVHVPAEVSLRKLLTAATKRGVTADITERVLQAFENFERLVQSDAGDREEMDAMISSLLPEERRKQDLASRQSVFKGMTQVKGLAAELVLTSIFTRPAATDSSLFDELFINGMFGLRRLRPDARIVEWNIDASDSSAQTLDGQPITGPFATFVPEFSTCPTTKFESRKDENVTYYRVAGNDVGMRSAIDIVMAERRGNSRSSGNRYRGGAHAVDIPARRAVLDMFVHKDVYAGVQPQLAVYDTAVRGMVSRFDDPSRVDDRLVCFEDIRALPNALAGARMTHRPEYVQLLEHVFAKTGWSPSEFRAYRLDIQYPVYGAEYMIGFDTRPGESR